MGKTYDSLYGHDIWTTAGPGGDFSLYRDNALGLPTAESFVEQQVTAALADLCLDELYAVVGPADGSSFEPSWASVEEEESGEFPGSYNYLQQGIIWSREDKGFSARFEYLMQPLLTNTPQEDDLRDAVFETEDGECRLTVEEW